MFKMSKGNPNSAYGKAPVSWDNVHPDIKRALEEMETSPCYKVTRTENVIKFSYFDKKRPKKGGEII